MPIVPKVPLELWKPLYDAAIKFSLLSPWEWMEDGDAFAVLNPEKNEAGYCCVLGNARQIFGLTVYLGSEGLSVYQRMQSGIDVDPLEFATIQNCLTLSFEDSGSLEREDKAIIKQLGMKFRGQNAWPLFRSHRPDFAPWFLEAQEVRFLTVALQQAADVAMRFKESPMLLVGPASGQYLLRAPVAVGDSTQWEDRWLEPEPYQPPKPLLPPLNEMQVALTLKKAPNQIGQWEIELVTMPAPIMDQDRPYFAKFLMCADSDSGLIVHVDVLAPQDYRNAVAGKVMAAMQAAGVRPRNVAVRQGELEELLAPALRALNIGLQTAERLAAIEQAKEGLLAHFGG